jgi:hypothetical protein
VSQLDEQQVVSLRFVVYHQEVRDAISRRISQTALFANLRKFLARKAGENSEPYPTGGI